MPKGEEEKKKNLLFSVSIQAMKNSVPWDWSNLLSGLRHFLKPENIFSGKYRFTTAGGRNWKLTGVDIKFNMI